MKAAAAHALGREGLGWSLLAGQRRSAGTGAAQVHGSAGWAGPARHAPRQRRKALLHGFKADVALLDCEQEHARAMGGGTGVVGHRALGPGYGGGRPENSKNRAGHGALTGKLHRKQRNKLETVKR